MLNQGEWSLFAAQLRERPRHALGYGMTLLSLVGRRLAQRLRRRVQNDPHRGFKQRPAWLPPAADAGVLIGGLRFPKLKLGGAMPEIAMSAMRADDSEAYFARHRWANCTMALGDEARAREAFAEVKTWLARPPARTDAAWETYSCCERVVNLALLLAAHPSLRCEADEAQLRAFFDESAAWINSHLEYYGVVRTNNHFLNNGRALVVAGSILSNNAWLSTGLAIVEHFAPELFPTDGCLREGSSHYQLIVGGWLFDVLLFATLAVQPERLTRLDALARKVGGASARIATTLPKMDQHLGDISPDLPPRATLARLRLLYGAKLAGATAGAALGEWLFAERGQSALLGRAVRSWPQAHTTHAHADLGSFIWLHAGRAILADAGRQDYLPHQQAEAQLGPAAHNTLMINGMGALSASVLRAGIWYPQPYSNAIIQADAVVDGFSVRHDGFMRIPGVGHHHREVCLTGDGLEVVDKVSGAGIVEMSLCWHFAPDWRDETEDSLMSSFGRVQISVNANKSIRGVWSDYYFSAAYGEARTARRLVFVWQAELPCHIHTKMGFRSCAE